jgi:uncharacterized protein (DUF427 family)
MRATWKGQLLAESDDTVVVEGNHYFPAASLQRERFRESATHSVCPWKGTASYYDVVVGGDVNRDAAWYYPSPKPKAANISGRVAFWKGVEVAALALFVLLGATRAFALEDLTGTWEGQISCEAIDGDVVAHFSAAATAYVADAGAGLIGVQVQSIGTFIGRYQVEAAHPDHAVVQGASCDFDEEDVDGAVLRLDAKTKAGSTKASLAGTLIIVDGPGETSTQCELKLKRTSLLGLTPACIL